MSQTRRAHAHLSLLIFAALAACGHGGGDGTTDGAVDLAAVDLSSNRPGDLSQNLDVDGGASGDVFFGMQTTNTKAYPSVSYTLQRFWDSPPFQWQTLQTAACADITSCTGGYDTTSMAAFDAYLAHLPSVGVNETIYTMARTPNFASTSPSDMSCSYTAYGGGACDRPIGLNDDGTGDNAIFRNWYAFFARRLNDPTYLAAHSHVRYWEIWNEPDATQFWGNGTGGKGSYAALVRMTEDMRCMLTGKGVVTNYPTVGAKTPCAQAGLPAIAIDPTALIVAPSYHAQPASTPQLQDFLYCSDATHDATCNTGSAGANAVDVINLHMKPGSGCVSNGATPANCTTATSVEPSYIGYLKNVRAVLQASEKAKPLWNDEADYAEKGFAAPYTDPDMAASYVARFLLMGLSLGVQSHVWYDWADFTSYAKNASAWNTLYGWIHGATLTTPCAQVGATTVYACVFSKGEIIWDISQACASGTCTSAPYTAPDAYTTVADLDGDPATSVGACTGCTAHQVALGLKPVFLSP
jgi:hypothetical protein